MLSAGVTWLLATDSACAVTLIIAPWFFRSPIAMWIDGLAIPSSLTTYVRMFKGTLNFIKNQVCNSCIKIIIIIIIV